MRLRLAVLLLIVPLLSWCQDKLGDAIVRTIQTYLNENKSKTIHSDNVLKVLSITADQQARTVTITLNEVFGERPLTKQDVAQLNRELKKRLPAPYNTFDLSILCGTLPIEQLIQPEPSDTTYQKRVWGSAEHKGYPWVTNTAIPYTISNGLQGRHISLWASHGRYYDLTTNMWRWQRPRLYCTSEDLFTQSIVVPFLMPMLENAGAIVWSPRERDWQKNEVIVDNDYPESSGVYREIEGRNEWLTTGMGWGCVQDVLLDNQNPFEMGSFVMADAQTSQKMASQIVWQPTIPEDGDYAVYVSYVSLPTSVSDATYTVRHSGVNTTYKVNQKMGSRTWVYLGTHHFKAGNSADNCVKLSNKSNYRGVVTADAVRFGGGMGSIARSDSISPTIRSGMPRYLEGSRYSAQWGGAPYAIYATKGSQNDYAEDINIRSLWTNHLTRGSAYLPGDSGLSVPLELSLAIHSDAGMRQDRSIIGTLGIYTTGKYTKGEYEGLLSEGLLPAGLSRMTSRDLLNQVMSSVTSDLQKTLGQWTRRQMYDRNYSETRLPEVPSVIVETLSHQNWADMKFGHDPRFKFLLARAIYKGVLRYVSNMHGEADPVVQPLPVNSFQAKLNASMDSVRLSWQPTPDALEPSALPASYMVQTAQDHGDWTNGEMTSHCNLTLPIARNELMRFRVSAVNAGGQSLPSAELVAFVPDGASNHMLIVNAFLRLAGPQPVDTDTSRGFDMLTDPGAVFHHSPCYCGRQARWDKSDISALGQSGSEYEHLLVAGNTFDYPTQHALLEARMPGGTAISSCMSDAFETDNGILDRIQSVDYILGAQREDGYSLTSRRCFTEPVMQRLSQHIGRGGSLLMSGAYLSEELTSPQQREWAERVLHLQPGGMISIADSANVVRDASRSYTLSNDLNEQTFSARRCSILLPAEGAFASTLFVDSQLSASVAYENGRQRILVYGFPLEMIASQEQRNSLIKTSTTYIAQ